eukprot:NODE_1_length_95616_cov_0.657642.p26 type:complete len:354 gc:universal NODE_1_length_95616_cov_0.657642:87836-88897(+)
MSQESEAMKCLTLAKRKYVQNDVEGAIRLAKKAKRMDSSLEIDNLINAWSKEIPVEIELTKKQEELLNRILNTDPAKFYDILELEKSCTEVEIKKSYRKLALHLHPDKCPHPKAKDAFLIVSKAFDVLCDPDKKRMFDMNGLDPDDRSSQSSRYQRSQNMRDTFNMDDILAEQIFAQFFGMQSGFQQFHNVPRRRHQTFHYSNPPNRNRARENDDGSILRMLIQCAPLILFIALSVLPSLMKVSNPHVSLNPVMGFSQYTTRLRFNYYASEQDINRFVQQGGDIDKFENELDKDIVNKYRQRCLHERDYRSQQISMASNTWFGLKTADEAAISKAKDIKMPSCTELNKRGINY